MHSKKLGNFVFHHNGGFCGNVKIVVLDDGHDMELSTELEIPVSYLAYIVETFFLSEASDSNHVVTIQEVDIPLEYIIEFVGMAVRSKLICKLDDMPCAEICEEFLADVSEISKQDEPRSH